MLLYAPRSEGNQLPRKVLTPLSRGLSQRLYLTSYLLLQKDFFFFFKVGRFFYIFFCRLELNVSGLSSLNPFNREGVCNGSFPTFFFPAFKFSKVFEYFIRLESFRLSSAKLPNCLFIFYFYLANTNYKIVRLM